METHERESESNIDRKGMELIERERQCVNLCVIGKRERECVSLRKPDILPIRN